ncbi:GAF domain-containing protein [Haladaptatus sp. CMAA 1911]|uniref:GAF domain-containing protein n=1 Tax=unclassified Haladaptatus TaxID=2622732 RepID=UPI003754B366
MRIHRKLRPVSGGPHQRPRTSNGRNHHSERFQRRSVVCRRDSRSGLGGHGTRCSGEGARNRGIQVVNDIETDPEFPTSVRRAALSQGYRLAICVPLNYGETTYGVLVVYGSQTKLLSDRERKIFDELGATLGYAIYTIKMQQLLFTDRVVEFEFDFTGTDAFFFTVSDELDCQLNLDAVVPTSTERLLYREQGRVPRGLTPKVNADTA